MIIEDVQSLTVAQVGRYEQRLRERAETIRRQVEAAKADGNQMPWICPDTGTDLSYEFEHWRRWAAFGKELGRAKVDLVADLPADRVLYWQEALQIEALGSNEPLRAFKPVEPLTRHVKTPRRQRFS